MGIIIFLLGLNSVRHSLTSEETSPSTLPAFPGLHPRKTFPWRGMLQRQGPPTPSHHWRRQHPQEFFSGITFPDNFNAICTLEPGSLKQLPPGWELQSISVFTSMFQRYQPSTPSTSHTGLARGSHGELLSPGAQQLGENLPVEERDGNQELRQSHSTETWISICLSHTGEKKTPAKGQATSYTLQHWGCESFSQTDGGKGRVRRRREGNKFKTNL